MARILILNGSPRAPKSNSKQYAEIFIKKCPAETKYLNITKTNHSEICDSIEHISDLIFVFPLYADSLPVTLLEFLKYLEKHPPQNKPTVSVLVNCGFIEPKQNDVAVKMIRLFCSKNGYPFGSVLKIGSGEAILSTPFRILVRSKIKKLVSSVIKKSHLTLSVTMPISKNMFIRASTVYWENYGKKNGITKEQMETMKIEDFSGN